MHIANGIHSLIHAGKTDICVKSSKGETHGTWQSNSTCGYHCQGEPRI